MNPGGTGGGCHSAQGPRTGCDRTPGSAAPCGPTRVLGAAVIAATESAPRAGCPEGRRPAGPGWGTRRATRGEHQPESREVAGGQHEAAGRDRIAPCVGRHPRVAFEAEAAEDEVGDQVDERRRAARSRTHPRTSGVGGSMFKGPPGAGRGQREKVVPGGLGEAQDAGVEIHDCR